MDSYNLSERTPDDGQAVLIWHPVAKAWRAATYNADKGLFTKPEPNGERRYHTDTEIWMEPTAPPSSP